MHDAIDDEGRLDDRQSETPGEDQVPTGTSVVVRRNAGLAALIGGAASAIAIAYLWRASQTGSVLDWVLCGVLTAMAAFYLATLLDARTPLVVADELGVRIRLGRQWRGLPWDAVALVEVRPRRSVLRDGGLVFRPHSLARALEGLETGGRRAAGLNQRLYGGALAVPLGLTTRASADPVTLVAALEALSAGRAEVTVVLPPVAEVSTSPTDEESTDEVVSTGPTDEGLTDEVASTDELVSTSSANEGPADDGSTEEGSIDEGRRTFVGGLGTVVSRMAKGRAHDTDATPAVPGADAPGVPLAPLVPTARDAPLRTARPASRAQITRELPATSLGATALRHDHTDDVQGRELRRPGSVALVFEQPAASTVRPIARLGDAVAPLVVDDFVTEPAYDPVIGPQLAAARNRTGLSVDDLADRTRIRPHVIEAIEVDDFTPCGGDFYARGHLRTLARVLGQDPVALIATFDNRYATAPINARRVFEAELATGMGRGVRPTGSGPNWSLLVGAVLVLVMAWGLVRLFETEPEQLVPAPSTVLGSSADNDRDLAPAADPKPAPVMVPVTLVALEDATRVVARDGAGVVAYSGPLVSGERRPLRVDPPLTVRAQDAGAVTVLVRGQDRGPVGPSGAPGTRTYRAPNAR